MLISRSSITCSQRSATPICLGSRQSCNKRAQSSGCPTLCTIASGRHWSTTARTSSEWASLRDRPPPISTTLCLQQRPTHEPFRVMQQFFLILFYFILFYFYFIAFYFYLGER